MPRTRWNHNCLNCFYEPHWSDVTGIDSKFPRRTGQCKWEFDPFLRIPEAINYKKTVIIRYSDDSGICTRCPAWKRKTP